MNPGSILGCFGILCSLVMVIDAFWGN